MNLPSMILPSLPRIPGVESRVALVAILWDLNEVKVKVKIRYQPVAKMGKHIYDLSRLTSVRFLMTSGT